MNARYKQISIFVVVAVMVVTVISVIHGTRMDEAYGMARIRLAHESVYVKTRQCAAGCTAGVWLSRSPDRCKAPDPAADYTLNDSEVLYAYQGDKLMLLGGPFSMVRPTGGDWIDMRFVSPGNPEANTLPLHAILFGERLPTRNVPTETVTLQPCVRAFGHNWNWL